MRKNWAVDTTYSKLTAVYGVVDLTLWGRYFFIIEVIFLSIIVILFGMVPEYMYVYKYTFLLKIYLMTIKYIL